MYRAFCINICDINIKKVGRLVISMGELVLYIIRILHSSELINYDLTCLILGIGMNLRVVWPQGNLTRDPGESHLSVVVYTLSLYRLYFISKTGSSNLIQQYLSSGLPVLSWLKHTITTGETGGNHNELSYLKLGFSLQHLHVKILVNLVKLSLLTEFLYSFSKCPSQA